MNREQSAVREELRDRFLEISLEEVLAEDGAGRPLDFKVHRRPARWALPFAAAILLVVVLPLFRRGTTEEAAGTVLSGVCGGVVRLPDGEPATGATVRLELGWRTKDLPEGLGPQRVVSFQTKADGAGRFRFTDLPPGSAGTVFASAKKRFVSARAEPEMSLTLLAAGRVAVRIDAPSNLRLRSYLTTPGWGPMVKGVFWDSVGADGWFRSREEPAGPATLVVTRGNWPLRRISVTVVSGKTVELPAIVLTEDSPILPSPNPLVDAGSVRLLDAADRPVKGAWFWFEGRGTVSDENGEVVLKGRGRKPPFQLFLGRVGGDGWPKTVSGPAYSGVLQGIRDGVAIVRLTPLRKVEGVVRRDGKTVANARVIHQTRSDPPRFTIWTATAGRYSMQVPPGPGKLMILTVDGRLHREDVVVKRGEGVQKHDIKLPD